MLFVLLGLFTGSFLNVCIDRLPRDQSIVFPPSHCGECNHKLGILDLIPVFSYLLLRGRCRYCRAKIPLRLIIIEALTASIFGFLFWRYGISVELGILIVYSSLLIIIFVIDMENYLVLNRITYPAMVLALVFSFFNPSVRTFSIFLPDFGIESSILGGLVGLGLMLVPYLIYRQGMGLGDVKLAALAGLMTGFPLIIPTVLISWILGGIIAAILLALKIKGRKDEIPAATFLSVSTFIMMIWGQEIWTWYLG